MTVEVSATAVATTAVKKGIYRGRKSTVTARQQIKWQHRVDNKNIRF